MCKSAKKTLFLAVSGPSGVGKGTCIKALRELIPELKLSVSATTRQPRPGEKEGIHYYFLDKAKFETYLEHDEIIEYDSFCGNYYGTLKSTLDEAIKTGESMALDITVKGSLNVKRFFPTQTVTVFIAPPCLDSLRERLLGRGTESEEVRAMRLAHAEAECEQAKLFDYVVVNNKVEDCAKELADIYQKELAKVQA